MGKYYDGTKLLSLKDANGNKPEIYICTGNRTAGKTTYFGRYFVNRFLKHGEKFMLLYRYKYECAGAGTNFFKDLRNLFFPDLEMTMKSREKGIYYDLYLNDIHCGYVTAINNAEKVKMRSHLFSDVMRMMLDEFQSEYNDYCPNEIDKLISIHTSVARGGGEQVRYVPLHLCGNKVTSLNPYYSVFGISGKIRSDTKFMRGNGWVLEHCYNESAATAQKNSSFLAAFRDHRHVSFVSSEIYLHDNLTFIEKVEGDGLYVCTLAYKGKQFCIRVYPSQKIAYCSTNVDLTRGQTIAVTDSDHKINTQLLTHGNPTVAAMRRFYESGCFRFKNQECKECVFDFLSY